MTSKRVKQLTSFRRLRVDVSKEYSASIVVDAVRGGGRVYLPRQIMETSCYPSVLVFKPEGKGFTIKFGRGGKK